MHKEEVWLTRFNSFKEKKISETKKHTELMSRLKSIFIINENIIEEIEAVKKERTSKKL